MDLREEKIPNLWILFGWLAGLIFHIFQNGFRHIPTFLAGGLLPVIILFLLFFLRMIGAGDIKLLSVLGGFMGPIPILYCLIYSFIFGAFFSVAILLVCGNLRERIRYFINYFQQTLQEKQQIPYRKAGKQRMEHFHFSVAILMSVLLWIGGIY